MPIQYKVYYIINYYVCVPILPMIEIFLKRTKD